ncbi:MAG: dynamin family protein [Verrucomicrobiota bacterium]
MIADQYLQLRTDLETAMIALLRLAVDVQRSGASAETLQALLADIREPLLFVVVGEVKAGKSSLLNALFGHEFARADVLPATDRVCIFRYGAEEKTIEVSPQLIERYLPIEFLRDFNVVDTPGTNTMVAEHQQITEKFVPRADLVLFVFSVVNPWTQSAWELLAFVQKRWLKNVVFVLQQADLREPAEVEVVRHHLSDTAMQKLGFAPPIFAVSARQALLAKKGTGDTAKLFAGSQFGPLEDQINRVVSEANERMTKLDSAWRTSKILLGEIAEDLRAAFTTIQRDEERLDRIFAFLQAREEQTRRQIHGFLRGIEQACRECASQGTQLLERRLTFWTTIKLVWRRDDWQRDFQGEMETKLRQIVQPQIDHAVQLLETDLRGIWPQLEEMLDPHLGGDAKSHAPTAPPDFSRQRRELLASIQLTLAERISGRAIEEQLAAIFRETSDRLRIPAGVVAAGGVVAVIAAMSSAAVADVTGVLAASAAVLGTLVAHRQRQKILSTYAAQMEAKQVELVGAIEAQITRAIEVFYAEIRATLQPLAAFCQAQRERHQPMMDRIAELERTFDQLRPRLPAISPDPPAGVTPERA